MAVQDDFKKGDEARVDALLSLYQVKEPNDDLAGSILRKAAMYPRRDVKKFSVLDFIFAPFRVVFFSREYLPITFSIVMFCLMILVTSEDQYQKNKIAAYNDYATVMAMGDNTAEPDVVAISRTADAVFVDELQSEMNDFMMSDLQDTFDI